MPVLTVIWNFVKAHWQAIVLVVAIGIGYGWYRHHVAADAAALVQLNAAHQVEIDTINKARADEQAQHQKEVQTLQQSLAQIQQQYDQAEAALQAQQTAEQTQIVKQYGNDANGLAQLLAGKLGFTVQTPPAQ
jgi:murein L,D-transpeptidase YcbB/YkuD